MFEATASAASYVLLLPVSVGRRELLRTFGVVSYEWLSTFG